MAATGGALSRRASGSAAGIRKLVRAPLNWSVPR
jgi:hypothetical protein